MASQQMRRAHQEKGTRQHVVDKTENIKAAVKGEMEVMGTRVNAYTNEACTHVKEEIKE